MFTGFLLTPNMESLTPILLLETPTGIFLRNFVKLHCGTPAFWREIAKWDFFQNPNEN